MTPEILKYEVRRVFVEKAQPGDILAPERRPIELSKAQYSTMQFIHSEFERTGVVPTIREIMEQSPTGRNSTSTIKSRLRTLDKLGCIKRHFNENDVVVSYSITALPSEIKVKGETSR